jgi:hypothetical protein
MNFSDALNELKKGKLICRSGWNGKDMFLFLFKQEGVIIKHPYPDDYIPEKGEVIGYDALPFIMMKTANSKCVPWLASQTDILADDWQERI